MHTHSTKLFKRRPCDGLYYNMKNESNYARQDKQRAKINNIKGK